MCYCRILLQDDSAVHDRHGEHVRSACNEPKAAGALPLLSSELIYASFTVPASLALLLLHSNLTLFCARMRLMRRHWCTAGRHGLPSRTAALVRMCIVSKPPLAWSTSTLQASCFGPRTMHRADAHHLQYASSLNETLPACRVLPRQPCAQKRQHGSGGRSDAGPGGRHRQRQVHLPAPAVQVPAGTLSCAAILRCMLLGAVLHCVGL